MSSTNKTERLALNQWVATDPFRMSDFNEDNQKIDAAHAATADAIAATAEAIAANTQLIAAKPSIAVGSYTGTGTMGANNKKTLTFNFEPKLVIIRTPNASGSAGIVHGITLVRGATQQYVDSFGSQGTSVNVTWGSNSVSWYRADGVAADQCNTKNAVYYYFAIG